MAQEDSMDFKTVRAMFEEKEYLLRQPKARPVVPEKPKAIPAPQSPTYLPPQSPSYLPAGARPSLLTSMTQALEAKAMNAPRVVFKDEKEAAKKPLIQTNVKGKEKADGKVKESKCKKLEEKHEDSSDQKDNKLLSFLTRKEDTAELVPAPPPPKVQKKKGFPVFKRNTKRNSAIILDSPSLEESGLAPLIPVPSDADNIPEESIYSIPKPNLLKENASAGMTPPTHNPKHPDSSPPPVGLPEVPVLKVQTPQIEPPSDIEKSALPDFSMISQNETILNPPNVLSPPTTAAPTSPTTAAPKPPTAAAPTSPTTAAPKPPTAAAPKPPTAAAPTSPTTAAPKPPTAAAPTPPTAAVPSRPNFAPPSPPKQAHPAAPSNSALPSHPNVAPQAPSSVAAPVPPNIVAPNLSARAVPDPSPSASLTPPRTASPVPLLSASPAQSPSGSSAPPTRLVLSETSAPSPPELQVAAGLDAEDVDIAVAAEESRLTPDVDSPSKIQRSISALTALERAEDMSTGKRSPPGDLRILNALEKARKKAPSPLLNSNRCYSITPPPEDHPSLENPTSLFLDLPPVDYEGKKPSSLKPAEVNGTDHRSQTRESMNKEGSDGTAELQVDPPRQTKPEPMSAYSSPVKPARPPSVSPSQIEFIPPPPLFEEFLEDETAYVPELEDLASGANSSEVMEAEWENKNNKGADAADGPKPLEYYSNGVTDAETEALSEPEDSPLPETSLPVFQPVSLPVAQDPPPVEEPQGNSKTVVYEETENMYEDITTSVSKKKGKSNSDKKRKGTPKNPYMDSSQATVLEKTKTGRFSKFEKKPKDDEKDGKELKKKEKQRLEKEKKEIKEKLEREKKEQKEREKKKNEMKKTFKITGQEEVLYQAKVIVATKGRKHNLPVKSGDIVNIIRTDYCPKGKWLARDSSNNYGYIDVQHVEMDFKEMLELGKKASRNSTVIDLKDTNAVSRTSTLFPSETYTDDSEEWTCDEDEAHSPAPDTTEPLFSGAHSKTLSMPDMGDRELPVSHQHSHSDMCDNAQTQARKEALQKLEIFLQSPKPANPTPSNPEPEMSPVPEQEKEVSVPEESSAQEDFDPTAVILPPPDQYADFMV